MKFMKFFLQLRNSVLSLLLQHFDFLFLLKFWHITSLQSILNLLPKSFDSTAQQKYVIITFFKQFLCIIDTCLFIKMVNHNDFTLFVFILKQLWNPFVPLNVSTREVKCLLNVKLFVFIRFTKINQYKICINASRKLLGFDGN